MHAPPPPQDPRVGLVLQDRYRLVRRLGEGGMGTVYEGEHVLIKKRVAVKILHPQFAERPEIVARFHREAEAATAIGHPNIVEVMDLGRTSDGMAFMVLELLQGRDWAHDIDRDGPQPLGKVVHVLSQVCAALEAAHTKGIVHRDLKPENIFLIERGGDPSFAKVLDFGISKFLDPSGENPRLTRTGTAVGTPYFMSPEQCQGRTDLDARADIYSLGVVLFYALTGRYPFDDESYPMLVLKICTDQAPPLRTYRPDLPPALDEIVGRMLAKDPRARFSSCTEVRAALEPYRYVFDAPVVTDAPSPASQRPAVLERSPPAGGTAASGVPTPRAAAGEPSRIGLWVTIGAVLSVVLAVLAFGAAKLLGPSAPEPVAPHVAAHGASEPASQRAPGDHREPHTATAPGGGGTAGAASPASEGAVATGAAAHTTSADTIPTTPPMAPDTGPARPPERAAPTTVRIRFEVIGPPSAQVSVDGVPYGAAPIEADMPQDAPPTPGQPPTLHRVEAHAPGWQSVSEEIAFLVPMTRILRMTRAGGRVQPRAPAAPVPQPLGGGLRPATPVQAPPAAPRPSQPSGNSPLVRPGAIF